MLVGGDLILKQAYDNESVEDFVELLHVILLEDKQSLSVGMFDIFGWLLGDFKRKRQEIKYFVEFQDCHGHDRFVMGITAFVQILMMRDMAMTASVMAMKSADMTIKPNFSPFHEGGLKKRKTLVSPHHQARFSCNFKRQEAKIEDQAFQGKIQHYTTHLYSFWFENL
ncbi:hypothetical protein QVD17_11887 [Tagetes erecta]|uniref:Uncharacterized protein n=1 Tax=Tagetes erecta TaxID=13708 RepID=A0AAD8KV96_TARER|nr:hypothetical protein QVD17_11887 [Tagetes erecta]